MTTRALHRNGRLVAPVAILAAAVLVACSSGPAPTAAPPSEVVAASTGPSVSAPSSTPFATATGTAIATTAPATPTGGPMSTPVAAPTATPSLDWATVGYTVGARSPVSIGGKAKVTIKAPVGPTCTLKVHYPSGGSPSLPSPTHPNPGWWVWTWTVKSSAGTGTATFDVACTYAGLTKPGDGDFKIVATPAPDGWSINVSTATTRSSDSTAPMHFTVHVIGTVPQDPETQMVEMACYHRILVVNGPPDAWIYDLTYFAPDAQFDFYVDVGALGSDNVGTPDWVIRCTNTRWQPTTSHEDSGSFTVY